MSPVSQKGETSLMAKAIREGVFAAIISFFMFLLYVGVETYQDINNALVWRMRWGLLFIFVAIAAIGRFLTVGFIKPHLDARKLNNAKSGILEISSEKSFFHKHFLKIALVFLLVYPFLMMAIVGKQGSLKYVDNFGIQILIYVMLAWGLNIVVGLAGLLDLGYVAFYAVGAYSYALLSTHFGLSFWILLPLSGIFAALWGIILGFPVLRLRGDYLAIVTLAFGEIIRLVLINWTDVTKGTFGVSGIAKASVFGIWSFDIGAPNNFAKLSALRPPRSITRSSFSTSSWRFAC